MNPKRYVPHPGPAVEAWEITEDSIEALATLFRLSVVKTWPLCRPASSGPVLALELVRDGETVREEVGGYLVRHSDGTLELLCQASMVARYADEPQQGPPWRDPGVFQRYIA